MIEKRNGLDFPIINKLTHPDFFYRPYKSLQCAHSVGNSNGTDTQLHIDEKHIFIIFEFMIWCPLIGSINQKCFCYTSWALIWVNPNSAKNTPRWTSLYRRQTLDVMEIERMEFITRVDAGKMDSGLQLNHEASSFGKVLVKLLYKWGPTTTRSALIEWNKKCFSSLVCLHVPVVPLEHLTTHRHLSMFATKLQ